MENNKKIYFASDFHLGAPDYNTSLEREKRMVKWLDEIKADAGEIYLVGDLFDFWFEYKTVVPKGFVRVLGKIAELTDSGVIVHLFTGNHDMWMFDYLPKEINIILHREPIEKEFGGKKFLIGHGDGLGPGDRPYKILKKVFANKICQWLFSIIHPDLGMRIANYWSHRSRIFNEAHEEKFLGEDKEWLVIYCKEVLQQKHYDYFIFGHRHLPLDIILAENSRYINLGEWFKSNSFAVFDGEELSLKNF